MKLLAMTLAAIAIGAPIAHADETAPAPQKAVLVTGASTGIGRKITERLAADGYFVYAGARKDKDLADLNAIKNVQGVRLDVTKPGDIAAAVDTVTKGGRGLYGLVNNAGVAVAGPLMQTEESDVHFLMDINTFGVFRVTRAFMPLIQKEKGRVQHEQTRHRGVYRCAGRRGRGRRRQRECRRAGQLPFGNQREPAEAPHGKRRSAQFAEPGSREAPRHGQSRRIQGTR